LENRKSDRNLLFAEIIVQNGIDVFVDENFWIQRVTIARMFLEYIQSAGD
jgi:hypothetical protein